MAKKKEQPAEEGSPAWMATFSDLMNLLLCFFVLLFATSNQDEAKILQVAASFQNASFSVFDQGSVALVDGQIVSGGVTQLPGIESFLEYIGVSSEVKGNNQELSATGAETGEQETGKDSTEDSDVEGVNAIEAKEYDKPSETTAENVAAEGTQETADLSKATAQELQEELEKKAEKQSEEMYDEMSQITEAYKIDDQVSMDFNSDYVSIDLNGAVLFNAGDAELKDEAKPLMRKVASLLQRYSDCVIEIDGYTDNVPIHNSKYESNRYLSTARANKVYEFIMDNASLKDDNMKIAGYGESNPIASNDTEEGRAKNRRVSIKIYNKINSEAMQEEQQQ